MHIQIHFYVLLNEVQGETDKFSFLISIEFKVTLLKFRIVFVEEETPLTYGKMQFKITFNT